MVHSIGELRSSQPFPLSFAPACPQRAHSSLRFPTWLSPVTDFHLGVVCTLEGETRAFHLYLNTYNNKSILEKEKFGSFREHKHDQNST